MENILLISLFELEKTKICDILIVPMMRERLDFREACQEF